MCVYKMYRYMCGSMMSRAIFAAALRAREPRGGKKYARSEGGRNAAARDLLNGRRYVCIVAAYKLQVFSTRMLWNF